MVYISRILLSCKNADTTCVGSPLKIVLKLVCFAEIYHQHEFAIELLYWIAREFPSARPMSGSLIDIADRAVATYRQYAGG